MYLNCHSYHSLRYGTIPVEKLVELASENGVTAFALTDINTITGVYNFIKECRDKNIKPSVGMEFREDGRLYYIGIAKNNEGFAELCRLRTEHNLNNTSLPQIAPDFKNAIIIYPFDNTPSVLKEHEYIGLQPHQLVKLTQVKWKIKINKIVALQPVTIRDKKEFNLNKILRAMDKNVVLSRLTEQDHCRLSEKMMPINELKSIYKEYPLIIENTEAILEYCEFKFEFKTPRNKKYYTGSKEEDKHKLEELAMEGLIKRYGKDHKVAETRLKKELKVINELNFAGYFLINWDIVQYSINQGIPHVGRGSGANSIVSYCLNITAICPIELNLYFERFLNSGRSSPPDFDIDWSWQNRNQILTYIFERFGKEHVAFCGTIGKFKYRSIIRELGKVFGLAKEEMDFMIRSRDEEHNKNSVTQLVYKYGKLLEGYPNLRSMHACGVIISEEPLTNFTALEMPPKGFPIVQFDMTIAEDVGFDKFDILSQRGLGSIYDCVQLVKKNRNIIVDIDNINLSKNEARANELLKHGKTIGCFYVESPAMRGLLRKLKCDSFPVLVAASSIIRPGVAESGMMGEYVFRHNNPDKFEYFHPVFEEYLSDTYGIMVYQEDVMKVAHYFGDLDLKDADVLRRGRTTTKEYLRVKELFFKNCRTRGYHEQLISEVFRQIQSFAGFSFCKAHSASYAIESYQSLYLKINYPVEHIVAVINNFGGFYRTEVYIHEARMAGANVLLPCVNKSVYLSSVEGINVYLGFIHLKALVSEIGERIPSEREHNGDYTSLENFINRVPAGIETIQLLIFAGAFRFTGKSKHELTLMARIYFNRSKSIVRSHTLFDTPVRSYKLPTVDRSPFEDAFDEIELFNFPVSRSPFDLLQTKYRGEIFAKHLPEMNKQTVKMLAYLISIKDVPTKNGNLNFGTWIDVEGNYFDTTHFADSLAKNPFKGAGCYLMLGRVEVEFGFPSITITRMEKMPFIPDPRYENDEDRSYRVHEHLKPDLSWTNRLPYPTEDEIGLPRKSMESASPESLTIPRHPRIQSFSLGNKR